MENHGQRFLYIRLIVEELAGVVIFAGQFIQVFTGMVEQADEIGGRACLEPIVGNAT